MVTKTGLNDFSFSENLLRSCPQYSELERRKTKTDVPCLPYTSKYTVTDKSEEVTWLAVWINPEFQYGLPLLQNSLALNQDAIATLSDAYIIRKPYQWDCVVSKDKETIKALLIESYKLPASEQILKGILV